MIAVVLTVVFILLSLLPLLCKYLWDAEDKRNGISGPPVIPILGNLVEISKASRDSTTFRLLNRYERQYGPTFRIRLFNLTVIFSSDVRVMEALNKPDVAKAALYRFLEPWLGKSLITSAGDRWAQLRRIATPAFHFQILEDFVPVFEEQADIMVQRVKDDGGDGAVAIDINKYLGAYTMDVIMETAMGVSVDAQSGQETEIFTAMKKIIASIDKRAMNPIYHSDLLWKFSPLGRVHDHCLEVINRFVENVIVERRKYLLQLSETDTRVKKKRMALLDTLLHSTMNGKPLTNEDLRGEVNSFTFAAHDTTRATITFLLYQLAKHPEVQQTLYEEIKSGLAGNKDAELTISLINSFRYLDLCMKETLRILTPVPNVGKKNKEEIKIDGLTIPSNSVIFIMIMANHMNPEFFPEPEKFKPERFIEETSVKERHPFVYAPFSVGLRNCVGQKFAGLNVKTAVIKLLMNFKLELKHEGYVMDVVTEGVMKPRDGLWLRFIPRV